MIAMGRAIRRLGPSLARCDLYFNAAEAEASGWKSKRTQ